MPDLVHPRTSSEVRRGTPVVVLDARGDYHDRIATTCVEWGRDFLVVWVTDPVTWATTGPERDVPDDLPWPAGDVWLPEDAPLGGLSHE